MAIKFCINDEINDSQEKQHWQIRTLWIEVGWGLEKQLFGLPATSNVFLYVLWALMVEKRWGKRHRKADAGLFSQHFPAALHCSLPLVYWRFSGDWGRGGVGGGQLGVCVCRIICFYFNLTQTTPSPFTFQFRFPIPVPFPFPFPFGKHAGENCAPQWRYRVTTTQMYLVFGCVFPSPWQYKQFFHCCRFSYAK